MADISQQECINLALDVFKKKGLLPLRNAAARAFDVHISAFKTQVDGTTSYKEPVANGWKLTSTEEKKHSPWIIDIDRHGLAPQTFKSSDSLAHPIKAAPSE